MRNRLPALLDHIAAFSRRGSFRATDLAGARVRSGRVLPTPLHCE